MFLHAKKVDVFVENMYGLVQNCYISLFHRMRHSRIHINTTRYKSYVDSFEQAFVFPQHCSRTKKYGKRQVSIFQDIMSPSALYIVWRNVCATDNLNAPIARDLAYRIIDSSWKTYGFSLRFLLLYPYLLFRHQLSEYHKCKPCIYDIQP